MTFKKSDSNHTFRYAIISDTHIRPYDESSSPWKTNLLTNDRARYVVHCINAYKPDFVIHLGDIVHPVPHLPTYGPASQVAKEIMSYIKAPCYFVSGNHDIGDKNNPTVPSYIVNSQYLKEFHKYYGNSYQSFDYQNVHFIIINSPILNSGLDEETQQKNWLEADLESNKGGRIHVLSHYPPFLYIPEEPNNYDNIDMPARKWLLDLLEKYEVEAFFAGHVHHFGYKKHNKTHIYNLFSTCFVRQDYSEMFKVEATDEYGRNDEAKLGYCTVDVYSEDHVIKIHRSYGEILKKGKKIPHILKIDTKYPSEGLFSSIGVHLRHPVAEIVELPYMGPIDEFVRKKVRNDYTILGLWEIGIKTLRLPLRDLNDQTTRCRLAELHNLGHKFGFFTVNQVKFDTVIKNRFLIDFIEMIIPWENIFEALPQVSKLRNKYDIPIYVANIESSVHRERKGPKFSHYISHGFNIRDTSQLEKVIPEKDNIDGFVFHVDQTDSPLLTIKSINDFSERKDIKALVNVKLASEDPAEFLKDQDFVVNRAAEAAIAGFAFPNLKVFLDTFIDHDRGYFPRVGLYDRRLNPGKGGQVLRNLCSAVDTYGSEIKIHEYRDEDEWKIIEFKAPELEYWLYLSQTKDTLFKYSDPTYDSCIIDLVTGTINPKKFKINTPYLRVKQT